jgi:aspartokinase
VALVVQKFGGTAVDGPERLRAVARRLVAAPGSLRSVVLGGWIRVFADVLAASW